MREIKTGFTSPVKAGRGISGKKGTIIMLTLAIITLCEWLFILNRV